MSGTEECDDVRQALGVYVIGAVEPADRRLIDQHLTGCARCRTELAGLAGLPALLGKVSADEVASVVAADVLAARERMWPSGQALRSQLARVARIRRNYLLAWIGVAAIAGAAAGSLAVAAIAGAPPAPRRPLAHQISSQPPLVTEGPGYVTTARVTNPQTRVSATVRYATRTWGLLLGVRVTGVPLGVPCELEVVDALGRRTTAGSWTIDGDQSTWYMGSSWMPLDDVSGFIVASSDGKPLVEIPLRESAPRHHGRGRRAVLPHDRRAAPAFGVTNPPPHVVHQGAGSVQMVSHNRSARRTRSSGHATDLVLADFVLHSACRLRC